MRFGVIAYAPVIVLLVCAAVADVRARRVPNWLTIGLALCGVAQSFGPWGPLTPANAVSGLIVGFAVSIVMHLMRAIGAGDVKLVAAVGAWIGPTGVLIAFAGAALIGMCLALTMSAQQGRLKDVMRNSVMLGASIGGGTRGMIVRPTDGIPADLLRRRTLPFAVAIAIASIAVIIVRCTLAGRV